MSEGGIVMPSSCAAAAFHVNNHNNNNNNNNNNSSSSKLPKRKFSFPAALHSYHLQSDFSGGGVDFGCVGGPSLTVATARRRFSNVSDVVSRKLSHTIGWRTAVPTEQIARQGKALCEQYVRWKLRRSGVYTKRCAVALRRARTDAAAAVAEGTSDDDAGGYFIPARGGSSGCCGIRDHDDAVRREVFPAVLRVGLHLERLDPKLYVAGPSVAAAKAAARSATSAAASEDDRAGTPTPSSASTLRPVAAAVAAHRLRGRDPAADAAASIVLVAVSRELFRAGAQVTWAKVVSLLCVAAGLAVDCARRGRAEQLPDLIEAVGEVIEDDLAAWIHYNGGWMGLQSYCKPVVVNVENPVSTQILYLMSVLVLVILFLLLLRWFDFISIFR